MFETKRLILRHWQDSDLEPFYQLNQDKKVMEFFPKILNLDETIALINKIKAKFITQGFGLYAAQLKSNGQFIGFIGLNIPDFESFFTPCVEIGWRLSSCYWGQGLAVEGALKCLEVGFIDYNLDEIVAFTTKLNYRSERVMQKLGMRYDQLDDFNHPNLPVNHKLSRHALYRMSSKSWL